MNIIAALLFLFFLPNLLLWIAEALFAIAVWAGQFLWIRLLFGVLISPIIFIGLSLKGCVLQLFRLFLRTLIISRRLLF
ncbi:MAG: hypothetical protein PXX73_04815 [Sideroxydans sp.]|nr:hypothetical protein [Sideroxydans sp.]